MAKLLEVKDLNVFHGPVRAVRDASLEVGEEEVVGIVGVNGAGKTSLMMGIMNLLPNKGKVFYKEKEISELPTHEISMLGIGYVHEDRRIYPGFTVEENIKIPILRRKSSNEEIEEALNNVYDSFPQLSEMCNREGENISGGEQQLLAVARAFAAEPSLLILDETFEGLSPPFRRTIIKRIEESMDKMGLGILMAESKKSLITEVGPDKVYRIERGSLSLEDR